jgi:hypothetical protein
MLLPEASDEGRDVAVRLIARSVIGKSSTIAFSRSYRDNAGVQRQVAPAIGSAVLAVRVAGCGGGFDARRLACADSYSKAVDLNWTSWTATQATAVGVLTSQGLLFESLTVQNTGPIPKGALRTFTENETPGSSGG